MRLACQNITALAVVLSIALALSACTADNRTGGEHTGGDRNAEIGMDANSPTSETPIGKKSSTSETPIGNTVANKRFRSVEKREAGLGPDGVEMGHWFIDFSSSTFEWSYSDVVESGSYVLDGRQVVGQSGDRQILGEYDPDSGILTWDGIYYRTVETRD